MTITRIHNLGITIQDRTLLTGYNADIAANARIGLIGRNGSGKSSLLSILARETEPSTGSIEWLTAPQIHYVKQEEPQFKIDAHGADTIEALSKWQVPSAAYAQLSGGEKLRQRLADAFARASNLLLLDEPTNHLDQEGQAYLRAQLRAFPGAVIIVSHDRAFLDDTVTTIWSIEDQDVHVLRGNYSAYASWREHERVTAERAYEKQRKKAARIEAQIAELSSWSEKAHRDSTKQEGFKEYYRLAAKRMDKQIKSKRRMLEKELEKHKIEEPREEQRIAFSLTPDSKVGKRVLEVNRFSKQYGDRRLWQDARFTIQHGEKLALVGDNGSGKTTFIRILQGEEPFEGELWRSPSLKIGCLSQTVFDLPESLTPEQLFQASGYEQRGLLQTRMHQLGFTSAHWHQRIAEMSMGERVKIKLLLLMTSQMNVLICDEPTNHLDLPSREQLEKVLAAYAGTLIVASHDRYFVEKVTNGSLRFHGGQLVKRSDSTELEASDDGREQKLALETELQAVLGELSYLKPADPRYQELDLRYSELAKQLRNMG